MKRPRFHMATLLVATLAFGALIGLNLLGRPHTIVYFNSAKSPDALFVNTYHLPRFTVGWPTEITTFPNISVSSDIVRLNDASSEELLELERLEQPKEWDSVEFQKLAPLLFQRFFGPNSSEPPPDMRRPRFVEFKYLQHRSWNGNHIAINTAVALAITLALSVACEVLLRRRKKSPATS